MFSAPRYHPVSTPETGRLSNAVTGRNRSVLIKPHLFAQTAQERTSAQSVSEALSAGEASLFADPLVPTLSVAAFRVFRFYNQLLCYHNLRLFASADVFFISPSLISCVPAKTMPYYFQHSLEGDAMPWAGMLAFSSKKEIHEPFLLEVHPFFGKPIKNLSAECGAVCILCIASFAVRCFCFAQSALFHIFKKVCFQRTQKSSYPAFMLPAALLPAHPSALQRQHSQRSGW